MEEVIRTDVALAGTEEMILATENGLRKRHFARRIETATNGAYYMIGENDEIVAIFKPKDEEDVVDRSDTELNIGDKADREVAAFMLDRPAGFLGVPPTVMVEMKNFKGDGDNEWKKGSLQKFMGIGCPWNFKAYPSIFAVDEVHKMTLIDIRFGNSDRHRNNVLVSGGHVIPIDHGSCFPKKLSDYKFTWMDWEQALVPYSQEIVDYVRSLNPDDDLEFLRTKGIELGEEAENVYKAQFTLLSLGVLGGYTAFQIGQVMMPKRAELFGIEDFATVYRDIRGAQDLDENMRKQCFRQLLCCSLGKSKRVSPEPGESSTKRFR